jgi:hypothetical protein
MWEWKYETFITTALDGGELSTLHLDLFNSRKSPLVPFHKGILGSIPYRDKRFCFLHIVHTALGLTKLPIQWISASASLE